MGANAEIVERIAAAFNEGEPERGLGLVHPEIEWHLAFRLPDSGSPEGVVRSREALDESWRAFIDAWEELSVDVEEIPYEDEEWVVTRLRFRGRLGGSRFEVDRLFFYACRIEAGRLRAMWPFDTAEAALAKAGATV